MAIWVISNEHFNVGFGLENYRHQKWCHHKLFILGRIKYERNNDGRLDTNRRNWRHGWLFRRVSNLVRKACFLIGLITLIDFIGRELEQNLKTVFSFEQIEKYYRAAFLRRPWPSSKGVFHFRWLKIKGIDTAFPISITLIPNHLK